ncbi:hypothetical protein I302_107159 [Kwoniella bestiolae CBS 10118]|uniref:Uncharacterized protein n=1 Tax=Kwoniella bestiolae CBS 10118 TaxID=1296100 RepID=A0A1B9FZB8_9TREE|nr:hypothetical protein I302_05574 [Kwoniella bestiolae CBS 10118]OCF24116.1 hypothetical protein I302_05574 [Kwoniella bestiolae CBS 10118]
MSHPISDRRILSTTWEILDKRPNEVFGCPALSLNQLYQALNTTYESIDPNRMIHLLGKHTKDLLGTEHKAACKSVRKGDNKDYWVVFKPEHEPVMEHKLPADEVAKEQGTLAGTREDPNSSWEDLGNERGEEITKTVELLSDLPGGAEHLSQQTETAKSARKMIFSAIGLRKEKDKERNEFDDSHRGHSESVTKSDSYSSRPDQVKTQLGVSDTHTHAHAGARTEQQEGSERNTRSVESPLSTSEEKRDEDWLEQTNQWDSKRAKPERKGTEMDIIDSYDYPSASPSRVNHDHRAEVEEGEKAIAQDPHAGVNGIEPAVKSKDKGKVRDDGSAHMAQSKDLESREEVSHPKVKTKFDFTDKNDISIHKSEPELNGEYYDYQQTQRHGIRSDHQGDERDRELRSLEREKKGSERRSKHRRPDELDHPDVEYDDGDTPHRSRHRHKSRGEHRSDSSRKRDGSRPLKDVRDSERHRGRSSGRRTDREDSSDPTSKSEKNRKTSSTGSLDAMPEPPTPFLIKSFEGLPFEPDTSIVNSLSWVKERYHLLLAEVAVLLSIVYIIQASGL